MAAPNNIIHPWTAAQRVFATPELAEKILLSVKDTKTLIHAERISCTCFLTIRMSPSISRLLWKPTSYPDPYATSPAITVNPLFQWDLTRSPIRAMSYSTGTDTTVMVWYRGTPLPSGSWQDMQIARGGQEGQVRYMVMAGTGGRPDLDMKLDADYPLTAGEVIILAGVVIGPEV